MRDFLDRMGGHLVAGARAANPIVVPILLAAIATFMAIAAIAVLTDRNEARETRANITQILEAQMGEEEGKATRLRSAFDFLTQELERFDQADVARTNTILHELAHIRQELRELQRAEARRSGTPEPPPFVPEDHSTPMVDPPAPRSDPPTEATPPPANPPIQPEDCLIRFFICIG